MELACANHGIRVYGYDNFKPLVEFWQCILNRPKKLAEIIRGYYQNRSRSSRKPRSRAAIFYAEQVVIFGDNAFMRDVAESSGFTESSIERVTNFRVQNISVELMDFKDSISRSRDSIAVS